MSEARKDMTMRKSLERAFLAAAGLALASSVAMASTITLDADPTMVQDEKAPRVGTGNPVAFASDCWQGPTPNPGCTPSCAKSNFYVDYNPSGTNYLTYQFPADAATFTVNDLNELSYWTFRPMGTPAGRDWYVVLYTRPTGAGDCSWYKERWIAGYTGHTALDAWTKYTTADGSLKFQRFCTNAGPLEAEKTLAQMQADIGTQLILAVSVHTDSAWNGFDGYVDGLEIKHDNGNVGRTNFGNTFLPASGAWSLIGLGLALAAALGFMATRRSPLGA